VASQVPRIVVNCWEVTYIADGLKAWNKNNVRQMQEVVRSDHCEMVEITAEKFKLSVHRCHTILIKVLRMHHCLQYIVPRTLIQEQSNGLIWTNGAHISAADGVLDFLQKIITGDKTCHKVLSGLLKREGRHGSLF
jgi:hypothetical protein